MPYLLSMAGHEYLETSDAEESSGGTSSFMTSEQVKILVSYDGSDVARAAFGPAARLAQLLNASIVLVRVHHAPAEIWSHPEADHRERELARLKAEWQRDIEAVGADLAKGGVNVIAEARLLGQRWNIPGEILAAADEHDVALICMATHGESGIRRLFVGSTTQEVIANSKRPVTLIRAGQDA
jgi:nucleotide-binding universal stress UspA family protein